MAASSSTAALQALILSIPSVPLSADEEVAKAGWSNLNSAPLPVGVAAHKQHNWDSPVVEAAKDQLLSKEPCKARLLAVSAEHSGDWLHALPIASCVSVTKLFGWRLASVWARLSVFRINAHAGQQLTLLAHMLCPAKKAVCVF